MSSKLCLGFCIFIMLWIIGIVTVHHWMSEKNVVWQNDEVTPTEDLMREHGVLDRLLLIYEEIIKRLRNNEFPQAVFVRALAIMHEFIENYHEKLEEDHLFPIFERAQQKVDLVATLRAQHQRGRKITAQLSTYAQVPAPLDPTTREMIIALLYDCITIYRPHEAREDTELFPLVRSLISKEEFDKLGDLFENLEHTLFGKDGFASIVKQVEKLEQVLGIYELRHMPPETPLTL